MSTAEVRAAAAIAAATAIVICAAVPLVRHAEEARFAVEPAIAESPRGALAVAWMSSEGGPADRIDVRVAEATTALRSPDGRYAADPVIVARDDAFDLVWLGFRQNVAKGGPPYDVRVYAARGLGAPVEIAGGGEGETYDRPAAVATRDGALRVVFRAEAPAAAGIALVTERGTALARTWVASGPAFGGSLPQVCASEGGARVVVTYVDLAVGVVVRTSDDGGATFPDARARVLAPADAALAFEGAPCVVTGDEVVVAYGRAARPVRSDASAVLGAIAVATSHDGGATFAAPDTVREEGLVLMHPTLAKEPSGALVLAYYAGRAEGDAAAAFRARRLDDGPSIALGGPLRFAAARDDAAWPGDYAGLASGTAGTFAAFIAPDRSGARRVEVARVP